VSRGPRITATLDQGSLRELEQALTRAATKAKEGVAAGVALTAEMIVSRERALVPVDTGKLRDGIRAHYSRDGLSAKVGLFDPDLYYALFVEWGTSIRPAAPFATPAAEKARVEFAGTVLTELRRKVG
jgi:HK97 gp10 family phage protein